MNHFYQMRNDLYLFSISKNNCYGSHLHKQIEMICVISGSICVTIGDETKTLTPKDVAIIFPNTVHRYQTTTECQMFLLIFDLELVNDFSYEFLNYKPENPMILFENLVVDVSPYFKSLIDVSKNVDLRIVKGYLNVILGYLFRELELIKTSHSKDINLSEQLLMYLDTNFTSNITLDSTAHYFGISKFYISHLFSDKLKISFTSYLNTLRINKSKQLLITTNDSITDIAYNSGYTSLRTFFRKFQDEFHMTPKEYREKNSKGNTKI